MLLKVLIFAATVWACLATAGAQTSADAFRDLLRRQAAFTPDEVTALERGGLVVKLLPVTDKREVAFCGVLRLRGDPAASLKAFKESLTQRNDGVIRGGGRFSTPPAPRDLESLTLEPRDIEDMKLCAVGDCGVKMSAPMIERLQREVDWNAPDHPLQATRLFRLMLADYVRDYLDRGDAALIEYHSRAKVVRLGDEQRALLASLPYVNDAAPEFVSYLQNFPRLELAGVENTVHWSKLKLGFKPIVVLTHTATYTREREGARQIVAATRQLYANHYFDSSLSLTLLTELPAEGAASETYLLYVNRSRAGALGGMLGGFKRRLVEGEVLDGLTDLLRGTQQNAQIRLINQSRSGPAADDEAAGPRRWAQWLFRYAWVFCLALLIVAGTRLLWSGRRGSGRTAH